MSTKVQLVGGAFQDAEGNVLANGYLELILNQDNAVVGSGNITAGVTLRVQLDSDGNAASSTSTPSATNQFIWGTDVMVVPNAYYRVTGYTANGQTAWGPNNQQIQGSGTFDLGTWTPNQVISWIPPLQNLQLEVGGTPNQSQSLLNLVAGSNVTIVDEGAGEVEISASSGGYASGSNVCTLPSYVHVSEGLAGYTIVLRIPASYIQAFTNTGFRVGVITTGVLGLVVNSASIGKTLPNSTAWATPQTPFTFPSGSFSATNTLYLSNICPIPGDILHDYYVTIYFDPTSAGGNAYATEATAPGSALTAAAFLYAAELAGYIVGNHTADADASALQTLSGLSVFCIQQILTA